MPVRDSPCSITADEKTDYHFVSVVRGTYVFKYKFVVKYSR
ncbi:hypothetical protein OLMES_3517 [Oleiphilus messinensis]|uniref:Uncharacterized protein n=1 Tax=Oleiphilus messinensis TaxID=141451 RepID=A0A1Y0IAK0_9GAMM|nr:hypothetical protein OLMES_3517 [Oleiphilus messinensis]